MALGTSQRATPGVAALTRAEIEDFLYHEADLLDAWQLEDPAMVPEGFRFDTGAARTLVSSLVNARAKEIVLEAVGADKSGLDAGCDVLAFVDKDGKVQAGKLSWVSPISSVSRARRSPSVSLRIDPYMSGTAVAST